MKKAVISIVSAAMLFGVIGGTPAAASAFTDIDSSPMKPHIERLAQENIISGYMDGTFRPKEKVTRAQYAKMLALAMGLTPDANAARQFTDLADWSRPYVGALVKVGISNGKSKTSFGGNDYITRQEMAVMFVRAMGLEEFVHMLDYNNSFADSSKISSWAKPHVFFLKDIGFADGNGKYYFPQDATTREAFAKLTYRFTIEEHKYFELALNRIALEVYENIEKVTYLGDNLIKVTYTDGTVEDDQVEVFLDELWWNYYYYSLEEMDGHDWAAMNSTEKRELIMFILDYWDTDYDGYVLIRTKEDAYRVLLERVNLVFLHEHQRNANFMHEFIWAAVDTRTIDTVNEE